MVVIYPFWANRQQATVWDSAAVHTVSDFRNEKFQEYARQPRAACLSECISSKTTERIFTKFDIGEFHYNLSSGFDSQQERKFSVLSPYTNCETHPVSYPGIQTKRRGC
jgi:hypothetical protein